MKAFEYCPKCGHDGLTWSEDKRWNCHHCGLIYYHNTAAAVAGVLLNQDKVLMTVRKHGPGQGMLDLPGGFVDQQETLEQALSREVREELNIVVAANDWRYLFSFANRYPYAGIPYHTVDAFFLKQLKVKPDLLCSDDVADAKWIKFTEVAIDRIAFDSVRNAVTRLQKNKQQSGL
ncbi:MAG: NUDIX domain-containing protein [Candidatus Thiodiazotropha sp.]